MKQRGHQVEVWAPEPAFYNIAVPRRFKKWMGYIDQYFLFPRQVKRKLKTIPANALFIFTDQALGPWIPLVTDRPHVIHCHDFLAQRSAAGEIPENKTSKSGQRYQAYIRKGYQQGKYFISVSKKTKEDLHRFLISPPALSEVVYNGMNRHIEETGRATARNKLGEHTGIYLSNGYILHIGGNQWYKNRIGVIEIYNSWRSLYSGELPLLMAGAMPSKSLMETKEQSLYKKDIFFVSDLADEDVQLAYGGASLFLYPSLAEGFGWPIAEAMAAGCPVLTTGEAPMTEVGGQAAIYMPLYAAERENISAWSKRCADRVDHVLRLPADQKQAIVNAGYDNVKRFNTADAIDKIEAIYKRILADYKITSN